MKMRLCAMTLFRGAGAALASLVIGGVVVAGAQAPPQLDPATMKDLVAANRILVDQNVIDVRGHVSVRDPANPSRFWITRAMPPGMAAAADMQVFDLEGKQVGGVSGEAYSERFIHARIYQARADVQSVVHAHTRSIVTMSVSGLPLKPVLGGAVFAGAVVPLTDGDGVHDVATGDKIAGVLKSGGAVVMRAHGMIVVGPSLQAAVGRSINLDTNAQTLMTILQMHGTPVYLTPEPNAGERSTNFGREWDWWKHRVGMD